MNTTMATMTARQKAVLAGLPQDDCVMRTRVVIGVVAALNLVVCGSRLYIRRFVIKSWGWDDVMVVIALIMTLLFSALGLTISQYGVGQHLWNVEPADLVIWLKVYYTALCTYLYVALSVKTSLIVFFLRIFPSGPTQRYGKYIIGFLVAFSISGEFALTFQCRPVQAMYDKTILDAKCWSNDTLFAVTMSQGVIMFVTDCIILILPMSSLWRLNQPLRKRLQVMILFSLGFVACAASLVRFTTLVYTKDQTDFTYSSAASLVWMNVEFNLGLVAGSLPSLRLLPGVRMLFSSWKGRSTKDVSNLQGTGEGHGGAVHVKMAPMRAGKHADMVRIETTENGSQEHIMDQTVNGE
ncbi:hypothetical protein EDC01DRAFT_719575 [Geopyxis carbonaria]|nr:hypothetical protein EDC01DRAFT_719575 [Geopyxis carbonaria]